ncbi:unnamed protein product (mitochondrion) [Plasmodiophora brassicae]|uniref:Uncharacterized protein n=1 Tax=Plasmodiophora brassicae TaxID=37360 RepID=A0A3P3Y8N8_PLABS|nr:unnamed protein product [Plasmodiophora brassicae]
MAGAIRTTLVLAACVCAGVCSADRQWRPAPMEMPESLTTTWERMQWLWRSLPGQLVDWLKDDGDGERVVIPDSAYAAGSQLDGDPGYFAFAPELVGSIVPNDPYPASWHGRCFQVVTARATQNGTGPVSVEVEVSDPVDWSCSESYMFACMDGVHRATFWRHGKHTFTWKAFRFRGPLPEMVRSLHATIQLFHQPMTHAEVSEEATEANRDFLRRHMPLTPQPQPRTAAPGPLPIDVDEIGSGDFLGIVRLDGLDPMLSWAMGSTTGHTAIALRHPVTNDLYVAESTAKSSYWPVDGVQATPFAKWMELAERASFNVVWLPLAPKYKERFDSGRAWKFFVDNEGFEYGYGNMLWSWVDTVSDNYPRMPPAFTETVISWEMLTLLAQWTERMYPKLGDPLFRQAWNLRLGTSGLSTAELVMEASRQRIPNGVLPALVERDSFVYNTTRFGKPARGRSMVCCVFVCAVWKAAGLFGQHAGEINCAEFTNLDVYALAVFDESRMKDGRPQACKDADPDNDHCQLLGTSQLRLEHVNSKDPFPHMSENCPSVGPAYLRPASC